MRKLSDRNPAQSSRALAFLAQGLTIPQTVLALQARYHPKCLVEEVERTYFPKGGIRNISKLEGAPREAILAKLEQLIENQKKASSVMKRLHQDADFVNRQKEATKLLYQDPDFLKKQSDGRKRRWKDPESGEKRRNALRERMKQRWEDPEFKEKMSKIFSNAMTLLWQDPEFIGKMSKISSERMKRIRHDPDFVKKQLEGTKLLWQDDEFRERMLGILASSKEGVDVGGKISKAMISRWNDPELRSRFMKTFRSQEYREKRKKMALELWDNPEFAEKMLKYLQSPERSERMSQIQTAIWQIPKYRERMLKILQSPERREIMRKSSTSRMQDAEFKKKFSDMMKRCWQDPEYRRNVLLGRSLFWEDYRKKKEEMLSTICGDEFGWDNGTFVSIFKNPENAMVALMLRGDLEDAMKRLMPFQRAALANAYWIDVPFDAEILSGKSNNELETAVNEAMEILRKDRRLNSVYREFAAEMKKEGKTT